MTQPEALSVIDQNLHGRGPAVAKDEQGAFERILSQLLTAESGKTVNALAEIGRLNSHQYPHMGSQLDH